MEKNPYSLYRETANDGTIVTSIEPVMTPETKLKNAAIRYFKTQDSLQYLKVVGGAWQRAGVSDFLLTINGRSVSMEMKSPSGRKADGGNGSNKAAWDRCTALQKQWLRETRAAGGVGAACQSMTEVKAVVRYVQAVQTGRFVLRPDYIVGED